MTAVSKKQNIYYPLDVEFKQEQGREFLVEKGNRYTKSNCSLGLHLKIFELSSKINILNESCGEELSGKAILGDIFKSISLFGCDRKLEYIDIKINSQHNIKNLRKLETIGFQFVANETYDSSFGYIEEGLSIDFYIHNLHFQKIKHSLEKNLIANIFLDLPTSGIEGLYIPDTLSSQNHYKILCNKERIINKKDLPADFITKTSYRLYKEKFYICTTEKSSFDLNKKLNSEDENKHVKLIKEDTSNTLSVDEIKYLNKIKIEMLKYIPYCFWALVIIIIKLCV